MRRASIIALVLAGLGLSGPAAALAEGRRVALSVGVSACAGQTELPKALGDAQAMAALFRAAGFDAVRVLADPGRDALSTALADLAGAAGEADIAAVFYAGCGAEVGGTAYLIPAGAPVARVEDLAAALPLEAVLQAIKPARRLGLAIYDASRTDPFAEKMRRRVASRVLGTGLARLDPLPTTTLVAYATKAGSAAGDGEGAHSPFTTALLAHLATPGLDVVLALGRVRADVLKATNNLQEPFVYGALGPEPVSLVPAARR